ncbi:hypothetical protein SDC9_210525 [bioreactor metagenome]|uniref:Uncharacterized protein n=1 Tax=bioreactor metagenome TaxID=1076179 RepID=A0A645JHT8_9ZZZZ
MLFKLAESVPEPAHDQTGFKGQRFILPYAWNGVAIDTHATVGVGATVIGVIFVLPKAAAEYRCLACVNNADANTAQLGIAAADNNGRTNCKTGLLCAGFAN